MKISDLDLLISCNLKRILDKKNIKNKTFATMTGKTKQAVSAYLNASAPIGKDMILFFSDILGVRPIEFFREPPIDAGMEDFMADTARSISAMVEGSVKDALAEYSVKVQDVTLRAETHKMIVFLLDILSSRNETVKSAIKSNIIAFHYAVEQDDEVNKAKADAASLRDEIKLLKRKMRDLETDFKTQEKSGVKHQGGRANKERH